MTTDPKPFHNPNGPCAKCGRHISEEPKYYPASTDSSCGGPYNEYLEWVCLSCGFKYRTACRDAK